MRLSPSSLRPSIEALWLGRMNYTDALDVQHKFVDRLVQAKNANTGHTLRNFLLLVEHPPVYTVGLRSHVYSEAEEKRLKALGAAFFRTDRGGLITFHGPGQLVAYPIMDLASLCVRADDAKGTRVGVKRYVHLIEESVIRTCAAIGVVGAHRSPDTGVWLGKGSRKIAAIGINVRRGITSHGLALNCDTDMHWFEQIVPCGLEGKQVTSLSKELNKDITVAQAMQPLYQQLAGVYQCDVTFRDATQQLDLLINEL